MILSGYAIRLLQNVRDGEADPLPDWNEWGGDLARGFKMWIVQLVWGIPIFLFMAPMAIGGLIGFVHGFMMAFVLIAVSGSHPVERFRGAGFEIAGAHLVGHIAYGIGVAGVAAAFHIDYGFRFSPV